MTQSTANWRNTHTHMDRTRHSLTHSYTVKTTWCEGPAQLLLFSACWVFSSLRNPPNSTWTTGSLTCVRDHSCVCLYTRGLGTPTASQHNIFDSEKLTNFPCAPDGIPEPRSFGSRVRRCTNWATPSPRHPKCERATHPLSGAKVPQSHKETLTTTR